MLENEKRIEIHSHTHYSNLRLVDSTNRPKDLVKRAIEIGLSGIAITDHESLSSHIELNQMSVELKETNPDFKIMLGNEIYLTKNREKGQRYYHFILIAKNRDGYDALKELSSNSWLNSYYDGPMERVPTLYNELEDIVKKYPNSLIASTACLGGEVSSQTMAMIDAENTGDTKSAAAAKENIVNFILWAKELFGEDFYLECAPGKSIDQVRVNKRLMSIAQAFNLKMVIGSDAHYLRKEDRYVHKAFLNSKHGEREVDSFYEYCYLQDNNDIVENLSLSEMDIDFIKDMFQNSMEIYDKVENFSLLHKSIIPQVKIPKEELNKTVKINFNNYPILDSLYNSEDKAEKYWTINCLNALENINLTTDKEEYYKRLEEEADIQKVISEKLETNMFNYPITLQHYINLMWECGSTVGAGRGSACSGLNHYLMGVTQLDPIQWGLPYWRYSNKERIELGDIDIDICPSKRPIILNKIKEERGQYFVPSIQGKAREELGCTLVATFGTEGTRSAILTACRGYRSEEFPEGIDVDTGQYLSSLIPQERGFLWSLEEVVNGDKDKGRKPVKSFVNEVNAYPGLLEIMRGIEGLISRRGSHASGVIMFDENPYDLGCFMKTPSGDIITQWDLHMAEAAGMVKYDFLVTEIQDKIVETINLLQTYGEIESDLTLREVYDKYLHPNVLPIDNQDIWKVLHENSVLDVFQFNTDVGAQAAKKIKPTSIMEMADGSSLMRLMASEKGGEAPMEKYIRFKNDMSLWYKEMDKYKLTKEEIEYVRPYFEPAYGVPSSQEALMKMLMDEHICKFSLVDANAARKIVSKKQMSKIPSLKKQIMEQAISSNVGAYVWDCGVGPQMG